MIHYVVMTADSKRPVAVFPDDGSLDGSKAFAKAADYVAALAVKFAEEYKTRYGNYTPTTHFIVPVEMP